jgi:TetR/AcrR family transcriptional regulator, cholesterol catabolism regulator
MAQKTADFAPVPRSRARRSDVVRAAARLFSERGYHGTSMQHLGEAMGLLRGSLYAHIGSKEELLFEVVDQGAEAFLERGRRAANLRVPAATRLEALLVGHVETASEHLEAATVFLNEWRYLGDERRAIVQEKRDAYEQILRDIIADGIEAGEFRRDLDIPLAARLVLSAANWTYSWYRPGGELTPTEIGKTFAQMLIDGFKPGAPGTNDQGGSA